VSDGIPGPDPVVPAAPVALRLRGRTFDAGRPAVMAIVNRTNDSFWSGNRHGDLASARRALDAAVELGADIVDVGGVRAGQEGEVVTPEQEIERVVPFLARAREDHPGLVLSLDTWRSEVARVAAAEAGLDLVNDTWAGHDRELVHVAARAGAGYVISHTGGLPPRTDPVGVTYPPEPLGVVDDALRTLREGAERAVAARVPSSRSSGGRSRVSPTKSLRDNACSTG